nr:hypothetical protein [Candidatus Mcinerneyibacteriales bacterium]
PEGLARRLEEFYRNLQLPIRLSEREVGTEQFEEMASSINDLYGIIGAFRRLDYHDIVHIYRLAL